MRSRYAAAAVVIMLTENLTRSAKAEPLGVNVKAQRAGRPSHVARAGKSQVSSPKRANVGPSCHRRRPCSGILKPPGRPMERSMHATRRGKGPAVKIGEDRFTQA